MHAPRLPSIGKRQTAYIHPLFYLILVCHLICLSVTVSLPVSLSQRDFLTVRFSFCLRVSLRMTLYFSFSAWLSPISLFFYLYNNHHMFACFCVAVCVPVPLSLTWLFVCIFTLCNALHPFSIWLTFCMAVWLTACMPLCLCDCVSACQYVFVEAF